MKRFFCQTLCLALSLAATLSLAAGSEADNGDLLNQGSAFLLCGRTNEAVWAYGQAAKAGNVQGAVAVGELLFQLGRDGQTREQVLQLAQGLHYLYFAATNRQPQACALLANGLENGIGLQTNLVGAYAWLQIAAQTDGAFRPELDRLAVQLEPEEILQAQKLARDYLAGHWPKHLVRGVDQGDSRLVVQGVCTGQRRMLVILNGDTLATGETIEVPPATKLNSQSAKRLFVSCRKIGSDYLLVSVDGEPNLKLLPLATR